MLSAANSVVVPWPLVVVGDGAGTPTLHRQARLRAVERLDLALLVAAEHQGVLGRIHVQPHHVQQLVREARIARELEGPAQVRLQAVVAPDAADGGGTHAQVFGQRAGTPVGGVDGLVMQCGVHDPRLHLGRDRCRPTRARRVLAKRIDATVQEALAPQRHLPSIELDLGGYVLVPPTPGRQQDHSGALLHARFDAPASGQDAQLPLGLRAQFDLLRNSHRSHLLELERTTNINSVNCGSVH